MPKTGFVYGTSIGMYLVVSGDFYNALPDGMIHAMEVIEESEVEPNVGRVPPFYVESDYGLIAVPKIGQMPAVLFTSETVLGPVTVEQLEAAQDSFIQLMKTR